MPTVATLLGLLRAAARQRQALLVENAALRHQLAVLKRSVSRPRIEDADRVFWILLRRTFKEWRDCVHFVQPTTVVRWHRRGFRYYWRRKSRIRKQGRPPIGWRVVHLIRSLSQQNPLWGAPRIRAELLLLGHEVAESTVARYRVRHRPPERGQRWRTFLRNHMAVTAACDFFVVPTLTFNLLYGFVALSHDRRRIVHVGVTRHPTAEWTARQITEAFPGTDEVPRFLLHDQDAIYGEAFRRQVKAMGIREVRTSPRSPWQNAFVERVIGSIRRECTDHIIPMGERHLLRVLQQYARYYNEGRAHQALDGNSPLPRDAPSDPAREVVGVPVLGGLHHRYRRVA